MASFNLIRNSRVSFTTNVAAGTNLILGTGFTTANTQELTVMDGFSFSLGTNAEVITVSEAGDTPTRGQRSFNTSLNPVEFSFSTYVRPNVAASLVKADEAVLWNALLGSSNATTAFAYTTLVTAVCTIAGTVTINGTGLTVLPVGAINTLIGLLGVGANQFNSPVSVVSSSSTVLVLQYLTAPAAYVSMVAGTFPATGVARFSKSAWNENAVVAADLNIAYAEASAATSNTNQLLPFGLIMTIDGITYLIDNAAMDAVSIDFGLDGIAMLAWTGKGTALRQLSTNVAYSTATDPVISNGLVGTIKGKSSVATTRYITNKLSTVTLVSNIGGIGGTAYTLALTGGNINISNGITYITPANLGVVNSPIGYFTGTRAITGSITAYLRTGTQNTAGLLSDMLAGSANSSETKYQLAIAVGGGSNLVRAEFLINGAALQIPTIDAQAVMSTAISFTAQGTDAVLGANAQYDLGATNDIRVRYFSN